MDIHINTYILHGVPMSYFLTVSHVPLTVLYNGIVSIFMSVLHTSFSFSSWVANFSNRDLENSTNCVAGQPDCEVYPRPLVFSSDCAL